MRTLTILLFSVVLVQVSAIRCLAQDWQWMRHIGGPGNDFGRIVAEDEDGNLYMLVVYAHETQGFPFPISHDDCYIGGDTVEGSADAFIAKYTPSGELLWLKNCISPGGIGFDHLVVDTISRSLFVVGSYDVSCMLDTVNLAAGTQTGAFISRWNYDGSCVWAKNVAVAGTDLFGSRCYMRSITLSESGTIVVSGSTTSHSPTLVQGQPYPFGSFLAGYSMDGEELWAAPFVEQQQNTQASIVKLASRGDMVYAYSSFGLNTATDTVTLDTLRLIGAPQHGYFIARLSPETGELIWFKQDGGRSYRASVGDGLIADVLGRPIVIGLFLDSVFFSTDTLVSSTPSLTSSLVAIYDGNGELNSATAFHSSGGVTFESLALDPAGGFYTTGRASPGSGDWNGVPFEVTNGRQIFVSRHAPDGSCLGVLTDGSGPLNSANLLATSNGLYVAMYFSTDMSNGSITLSDSTFTTYGYRDVLLAKLDRVTGIQSFSHPKNNSLHIYANPNNGLCTIDLPDALRPSNDLFLSVYDNTGQLVQRAPLQFSDDGIRLDVRAQAKGIYHVELGDGRQRYTGTIVFE
jgi:hypothetical protein